MNPESWHRLLPRVYIIVLNWNGWRDTIECLESVFRVDYQDFRVVVCDNASRDGSFEKIKAWARGEVVVSKCNPDLMHLAVPPVQKPIQFEAYSSESESRDFAGSSTRLILIQSERNRGFAGGNNVGLRCALAQGDCEFAWLLNNDTVVDPNALSALVERMQQRPDAGICGSTLLYYRAPRTVQALGGSIYNRWVARMGHIGGELDISDALSIDVVERKMKYVIGASMMVRRSFLEQVGLMNEQYFLYFEEIDWATRAKGRFSLAYCPGSLVYHKEGSSTGSLVLTRERSVLTEFYGTRARVLFTRMHHPEAMGTVCAAVVLSCFQRLLKGNWSNCRAALRGLALGLSSKLNGGSNVDERSEAR